MHPHDPSKLSFHVNNCNKDTFVLNFSGLVWPCYIDGGTHSSRILFISGTLEFLIDPVLKPYISKNHISPIIIMPTDNPAKPKRPLSKFALKYGPYPKNGQKPDFYKLLKGYRSGFTPVSPNKTADRERRRRWKNAVRLQQLILTNKIPLSEIRAIGAYAPTAEEDLGVNWEPTKLKNPIHPLFAKHNWERMPDYIKHYPPILIGDGHSGHFLVSESIWPEIIL